jgi:hypothetical protein
MFNVTLSSGAKVKVDADGFKTLDNGQLALYVYTEEQRNRTVAVFADGLWAYFSEE